MGFSPDWNNDFLFVSTSLLNVSFREAEPLDWDESTLIEALEYEKAWIAEANNGIQEVDDFSFKYFYDPPVKLVAKGRILFTYMDSAEFFTLDTEQRSNLDFRWLAEQNSIPLIEGTVYYGIYNSGNSTKGAEAFTQWFFQPDTQRLFLENNKKRQLNEIFFGITGGFSAMRNVTEEIFPQFYPSLLGHIPPDAFLHPAAILPQNWLTVKERVILPYMHEYIRAKGNTIRPLERRITDWYRVNR
jgi:ABC-type glycerol-3-phosphate transport system substrate-binding protein